MKQQVKSVYQFIATALILSGLFAFRSVDDARMISIRVTPDKVQLFWKDERGQVIGSLQHLKEYNDRRHQQLIFAMNGGMYQQDQSPQGLYVSQGHQLAKIK